MTVATKPREIVIFVQQNYDFLKIYFKIYVLFNIFTALFLFKKKAITEAV